MKVNLTSGFKRAYHKPIAFCEANGWEISLTNGKHVRMRHPVAGTVIAPGSPSDFRGPTKCLCDLRRAMRAKNLTIKE